MSDHAVSPISSGGGLSSTGKLIKEQAIFIVSLHKILVCFLFHFYLALAVALGPLRLYPRGLKVTTGLLFLQAK